MLFKDHLYPDEPTMKLISLITDNVEYLTQLLDLWELMEKNHKGEANTTQILKMYSSIFKTILTFPSHQIHLIAQSYLESYGSVLLDEDGHLPEYLSFQYFSKSLTLLIYYVVENLDLRSAQGLLNWFHQRIVEISIFNMEDKSTIVLPQRVEVIFYSQENVEFVLRQDVRFKRAQSPLYFEELVLVDQMRLDKARLNPQCIVKSQLRRFEAILPTGISAESILVQLQNNQFKVQQSYSHLHSSQYPEAEHISLIAVIPASLPATMPMVFQNAHISVYPILSVSLTIDKKKFVGGEFQFYRLNSYLIRPLMWSQHQNPFTTAIYYNVKSEFFSEDDFGINQIAKLQKKWEMKGGQAKKQLLASQLMGQDLTGQLRSSNLEKQVPKDYASLTRSLFGDLQHEILQNQDAERLKDAIEYLKIINNNKLQMTQPPEAVVHLPPFASYISKFASKFKKLPADPTNPFEEDVIDYANRPPLQILLVGKPRSGRTTLAKQLAKQIDVEHIDLERPLLRIFDKVKENEENPQMDDEGIAKEFLTPLERDIYEALRNGGEVPEEHLLELLNLEFSGFDAPTNKGFILDLPIETNGGVNWVEAVKQNKLKLPKIQCRLFTQVIVLQQSEEAVKQFSRDIMERQEDLTITSQAQRDELRRPKVKPIVEDEDDPAPEEEEEEVKPLNEADLFFRPSEDETLLQSYQWDKQNNTIQNFYNHLLEQDIIRIDCSGLTVQQMVGIVQSRLPKIKAPLAVKLEGGSEKELLTINLDEQKISRQFSQWQQTDPVELFIKQKAVPGKVEFACDYAGRVFLFDNELNQNMFLGNPRKYINKPPVLPPTYNVAIVGPRKSGKKTIARLLSQEYGWTTIDVEGILRDKMQEQRSQELEKHKPSTFDTRINDIHLTEHEWKDFYRGNNVNAKDVLPMILNFMKCGLQRKPLGWGEPKKEDDPDDQAKIDADLLKKQELAKKNLKKKKDEEVPLEMVEGEISIKPITPPPEDVPSKEIIPLIDLEGKLMDNPRGMMLVGYPHNQEQIELMTLFGIKLDKVIYLVDRSEEIPGSVLLSRPGFSEVYNVEQELAQSQAVVALLKESCGEENIKEIGIEGTIDDVWIRVRTQMDPFYIRVDDESLVRTPGDVQEGDDPLPVGNYGNFCAYTLKMQNWLLPGKEEFISQVRGRTHRFFGEKEQLYFQQNVGIFLDTISVPPPRIMFVGVRGAGLTTQLNLVNQLYKIPLLLLRENLLRNLDVHKKNRQQERFFMKGFKAPEFDEEGKEILDPEIQEEPSDFDRRIHEVEVVSGIMNNAQSLIIDGNFFDVPEELLQTSMVELLVEARKLPEFVIFLKIEQKTYLQRNFDSSLVQKEYQTKMEDLKQKRQQERLEARKKAIEDGVPDEELPSLDAPEGGDEEDLEAPKLEEMLNEKKEKLIQQHEADSSRVEELCAQFLEELKIPAVIISTDTTIQKVTDRIVTALQPYLDRVERENMLERSQTYKLVPYPDPESFTINRLQLFEENYNFRQSRYGDRNPLTMLNIPHNRDYPLLYRNRVYYFNNQEEQDKVASLPLQFLRAQSVPTDVLIKPIIFVIGKPKSGKSTIAKLLSSKLSLVRIKVSYLIEQFILYQEDPLAQKAKSSILSGQAVNDHTLIAILCKRVQMEDCYKNGWILDGYPQTREQAVSLTKSGIIPTVVFAMETDLQTIKKRVSSNKSYLLKFGAIDHLLQVRLNQSDINLPLLSNYYQTFFNNVRFLSTIMSNWGLITLCESYINYMLKSRADMARALITQDPVNLSALTLTEQQILEKLSPILNYCPVDLKLRTFNPQPIRGRYLVYYDDQIYLCANEKAQSDFIDNPIKYVINSLDKYNIPVPSALARSEKDLEFQGKCPIALSLGQLEDGHSHLIIQYKKKWFSFATVAGLRQFEYNPKQFKRAHLPDKMPLVFENHKNIAKKVAKRGDCTSYLELHLRNITIRVLAQLGYKRMKYPTLSCKETVLKFIAISLKANNANKDQSYRTKYQKKLDEFLRHCEYPQEIQQQASLKKQLTEQGTWQEWDQENLLKMTEQFDSFMGELKSQDKQKYFYKFIR